MSLNPNKVISGTFGRVWLDGALMGEAFGLQAKIEIQKDEFPIAGSLVPGEKITGWKGTGSLKFRKVDSRLISMIGEAIKRGENLEFEILSELADPTAYGAERILYKQVSFNDLTLSEWEVATRGDVEAPFTFRDYKFFDLIQSV